MCRECDGNIIGKYESYAGKLIANAELPEAKTLKCEKIVNETGVEFLRIENVDYKLLKLFLLSILWKASISKRPIFHEVSLGPYEEKIRRQLYEGNPSIDTDIKIVILSWCNDPETASDIIGQPRKHRNNGHTYYSFILTGYIIIYYISNNSIPEYLKPFRLKEDNTLSIIFLPKGSSMDFLLGYTGVKEYIKIDTETIEKFSDEFLTTSKSNPFNDKNIFFTQGLRTTKYIEFQIIGNLGGRANDYEFNTETDYYIIADSLINELRTGMKDEQLQQLEKKINAKSKKHVKLKIISETAFLKHVKKRCNDIGDNVTLDLINQVS